MLAGTPANTYLSVVDPANGKEVGSVRRILQDALFIGQMGLDSFTVQLPTGDRKLVTLDSAGTETMSESDHVDGLSDAPLPSHEDRIGSAPTNGLAC